MFSHFPYKLILPSQYVHTILHQPFEAEARLNNI
jgi:hypothetical protein